MGAFFYFVQPQLWNDIAEASNEYFMEKVDERVTGQYEKQLARERKQPGYREKHQEEIKTSLLATSDITSRELCVFSGLCLLGQFPPTRRSWNIIGNLLMKARFHEVALASSCQETVSCTFPEIYISVATRTLALQATVRGNFVQ
ncbi:hypothetical protein GQ600_27961 [Phytophthora cactorum]|nr:hypothetical protein GQ600_27961 [Phytophthora cactorum]